MLPLAVTSTAGGSAAWAAGAGSRCIAWYISRAIAGVVHYYWLVKSDIRLPVFYGTLVGLLLLYRAVVWLLPKRERRVTAVKERTVAMS